MKSLTIRSLLIANTTELMNWSDVVIIELLKTCKPEFGLALLLFWNERIAKAIEDHKGKIYLASILAGGTIGIVAGPIKIPIGAAVGLIASVVSTEVFLHEKKKAAESWNTSDSPDSSKEDAKEASISSGTQHPKNTTSINSRK